MRRAGRSVYATGRECEPRRVIRNQLNAIRTAPGTARSPCGYGVLNYDDAPAPLAVHASRLAWLGVPRCDRTPPVWIGLTAMTALDVLTPLGSRAKVRCRAYEWYSAAARALKEGGLL